MLTAYAIAGDYPMHDDHVYRTVAAGEGSREIAGASHGLLFHPAHDLSELYTGIVIVTPQARLVVLEGASSLATLHRDALALAGLTSAQTLLAQPTTFRWFSALLMRRFSRALPDFTLDALARLCTASPSQLCTYVSTLALRAQDDQGAHRKRERSSRQRAVGSQAGGAGTADAVRVATLATDARRHAAA